MFNPLTPDEMVGVLGTTLKAVARQETALTTFEREQLLSGYSLSRHVQGDLRGTATFATFAREVSLMLESEAAGRDPEWVARLRGDAVAVARGDRAEVGATLSDLFIALRACDDAFAAPLADRLRHRLRVLVEADIALLGAALSPPSAEPLTASERPSEEER